MRKAWPWVFRVLLSVALATACPLALRAQALPSPDVSLQSVDGVALQGSSAILDLTLSIHNPGALALPLHKLRFQLQLAGLPVAQGVSTAAITIPPQQQAQVPVQVQVDGAALLGLLPTLSPDGTVPYVLQGTAEIGQTMLRIPFVHRGVVRWGLG